MTARERAERLGGLALAAALLLAPFGDGGAEGRSIVLWHALVLIATLALWVAGRRPQRGAWTTWLALWMLWRVLCVWLSGEPRLGWQDSWDASALLLAGLAAAALGREWLSRLVPALAAGILLQAGIAGWQLLGGPGAIDGRPAGTLLNPNHLAAWLLLAGAIVFDRLRMPASSPRLRQLGWVALLCGAGAWIAAGSRGAALGLALAAGVALLGRGAALRSRRVRLGAVALLLALTAVAVVRGSGNDPFRYGRLAIWRASVGIGLEQPVHGVGPGTLALVAPRHGFPDDRGAMRYDRGFTNAHSEPLRVFAECGVPGLLLLLALGIALGRALGRSRRPGAAELAAAAIAVQALVDQPAECPAASLLWLAIVGSAIGPASAERQRTSVAVALALIVALGWGWLRFDAAPVLATRAMARPDGLELALRLDPTRAELWRERARRELSSDRFTIEAHARARDASERALRLSPGDFTGWWQQARVLGDAALSVEDGGALVDATWRAYEEAARRAPYEARLALDAAEWAQAASEPAAIEWARRAVALEPRAARAQLLLAELELQQGAQAPALRERLATIDRELERVLRRGAGNAYQQALSRVEPERLAALRRALEAMP